MQKGLAQVHTVQEEHLIRKIKNISQIKKEKHRNFLQELVGLKWQPG